MRRSLAVALTLFSVYLVVSVSPVAAASTGAGLAVGSKHTGFGTGDEAPPATLSNLTVSGTGSSATVTLESGTRVVEDAEDGDLAEYVGDTGGYSLSTTNADGTYSIKSSGDATDQWIYSTSGLPAYPSAGDTFSLKVTPGNLEGNAKILFGVQSNHSKSYLIYTDFGGGQFALSGTELTGSSTSTSYTAGQTYEIEVEWGNSGSIVATLLYENGTQIAQVSGTSTALKDGGIGFGQYRTPTYIDSVQIESTSLESGTYVGATHSVSNAEQAAVNLTAAHNVSVDLAAEYNDGSSWVVGDSATVTTTGNYTLTLPDVSSSQWRVRVDVSATGGTPQFGLADESILFTNHAPASTGVTPTNGTKLSESSTTFSVTVSDEQFGTAQGEAVEATLYVDGASAGTATVNSNNGTASVSHSLAVGGEHSYYWKLTDKYGATTTTDTQTVFVPAKLEIRRETGNHSLITEGVNLSVRFYPLDGGDAITRQADNGTVDLAGLPVNKRFVVTVEEDATDKWTYRRIVIDSIYETSTIYLLSESLPHSQVVFELQDPTGQFPPEETVLYVERALTINNTTQYVTIAGDTFGSTGRFPVVLQEENRYRLRVATTDGTSERILGAYSVYGATVEPLQIQRIEPNSDVQPGDVVYGSLDDGRLAVRYQNLSWGAREVTYQVVTGNGTVIVPNTTTDASQFAHIYPVNASETSTFTVEWSIEGGESGSFTVGQVSGIAGRLPMDAQVLSIVSWVLILATMGLLVIVDTKLAPIGGVGMASGLVIMGTVAIPAPILGVAGAVSVLTLFGGER